MTKLIVIDPGHGGTDPGAVGGGLREKDITLKLSLLIRDHLLANYECKVELTRTTDVTLSLPQRTNFANQKNADHLVSIHVNAGGGTGYEDFVHTSASSTSIKHRDILHAEITKVLAKYGVTNRGKKSANFHMVRESKMPAALTETLFIDRPADQELLRNEAFLRDMAVGHAEGIAKALGLKAMESNRTRHITVTDAIIIGENGSKYEGFVHNGTTFAPVRQVAESVGYKVGWNQADKTVTLTKGAK